MNCKKTCKDCQSFEYLDEAGGTICLAGAGLVSEDNPKCIYFQERVEQDHPLK